MGQSPSWADLRCGLGRADGAYLSIVGVQLGKNVVLQILQLHHIDLWVDLAQPILKMSGTKSSVVEGQSCSAAAQTEPVPIITVLMLPSNGRHRNDP